MLRRLGLGAALAALGLQAAAAPPTPAERYRSVAAAQPGGCPSLGDVDLDALAPADWQDPPPNFSFHSGLRLGTGIAFPMGELDNPGAPKVMISWEGGHHERVGGSVIALRGKDRAWRVDGVTTFQLLAPPPPGSTTPYPNQVKHDAWTLEPEAGQRLDALIDSPCLKAEPRRITYFHPLKGGGKFQCVGGATSTVEVIKGRERIASSQSCGAWGTAGEIGKLIAAGAPKG